MGVTSEALAQYAQIMESVSVPVLLSHGNHEMCSGYLPREQGGTMHASADIGGVHFLLLDVVRYFEPTEDHPANWHVLADEGLLEWLAADLAMVDRATSLVVASHVPSPAAPSRCGSSRARPMAGTIPRWWSTLVVHADGSSTVIPPTGGIALGLVLEFTYEESAMTLQPRSK